MSMLGKIIWFVLGGAVTDLLWCLAGIIWSVTVIGIPVAKQCFKIARLCFCPFGETVVFNPGTIRFLMNLIWISVTGWTLAVETTTIGIICRMTIVGIPLGGQYI